MNTPKKLFERRQARVRSAIKRAADGKLRLSVFRSGKHIYAQIIDDVKGSTLASASTLDKEVRGQIKKSSTVEAASFIGKVIAERAAKSGISEVVFDRGGYIYHGRVKALADAAREAGLKFQEIEMVQATDRHNKKEVKDELVEKLVHVNRVAKTVKGGRTVSFAAVVVVGDQKGRIGLGTGKAMEVPDAIVKATNEARKNMIRIPLREGRTLHHDVAGRFGAGKVVLRTAPAGTGVIAGGPMRAVFEVLGVQDVVAKSLGSNNPYNMVKATFDALKAINSPRMVATKRGKKVGDIVSRREGIAAKDVKEEA